MKHMAKYLILAFAIFTANSAHSTSVFPNPPSINFAAPTTVDFVIAYITGNYATPGFVLNAPPTVDIGAGGINITFDTSSPTGPTPSVLDPFSYSVDIGQLSAGDWYLTPIFYVDGVFDNAVYSTLPLFTVTAVPVPAAFWLFGSGLLVLARIAKR